MQTIKTVGTVSDFLTDLHNEGFWYALTDKHFKEWVIDSLKALAEGFVYYADVAIVIVMILALFAIFGSRKAKAGIWWTFATYLITKALGMYL